MCVRWHYVGVFFRFVFLERVKSAIFFEAFWFVDGFELKLGHSRTNTHPHTYKYMPHTYIYISNGNWNFANLESKLVNRSMAAVNSMDVYIHFSWKNKLPLWTSRKTIKCKPSYLHSSGLRSATTPAISIEYDVRSMGFGKRWRFLILFLKSSHLLIERVIIVCYRNHTQCCQTLENY